MSHGPTAARAQPFTVGLTRTSPTRRGREKLGCLGTMVWFCGLSHLSRAWGQMGTQDRNGALRPGVRGAGLRLLVLPPGAVSLEVRLPLIPRQEAPLDDLQEGVPCLAHGEGHALRAEPVLSPPLGTLRPRHCPTPWSWGCEGPTLTPSARILPKAGSGVCSPAEPHRLWSTHPSHVPRALRGCPRRPHPSAQP